MVRWSRSKSCLIVYTFLCFNALAQPKINFAELEQRYKAYNAVYIEANQEYLIDILADTIFAQQKTSEKILVLSDRATSFATDNVYSSSFVELKSIDACTWLPKNNGFEKMEVHDYKKSHNIDGGVFYDDSQVTSFTYPSVQKGGVTSKTYEYVYTNPHFLRGFFFKSYLPIEQNTLLVKVNKNINIGFKLINGDNLHYTFREYEKGKYKYYEWKASNLLPEKTGNRGDYFLYSMPHLLIHLKDATLDGKHTTYFGTVDDLYHYYYGYISHLSRYSNDSLNRFTQQLLKDCSTDDEKARTILYWVQDNIKYVAYEQGMRGYIPNEAGSVFQKRYGDCKDMSSIICKMMNSAGLPTYFSWVGTRDLPYYYSEVPLPNTDNHMVTTYLANDSIHILDGTMRYLPFGVPPQHLIGKEILIGIDSTSYRLFKVPNPGVDYSVKYDSTVLEVENSQLIGKALRSYSGYNRWEMALALEGVKEDKMEKALTSLLNRGSNKFFLTRFALENTSSREKPIRVDYSFRIEDYAGQSGNEIFLNLNIDKPYNNMMADTSLSDFPIINDFFCKEEYITSVKIPEGYAVNSVPGDVVFNHPQFEFSIHYSNSEGKITQQKSICFRYFMLQKQDVGDWNQMIKELGKAYRETISFKKI